MWNFLTIFRSRASCTNTDGKTVGAVDLNIYRPCISWIFFNPLYFNCFAWFTVKFTFTDIFYHPIYCTRRCCFHLLLYPHIATLRIFFKTFICIFFFFFNEQRVLFLQYPPSFSWLIPLVNKINRSHKQSRKT